MDESLVWAIQQEEHDLEKIKELAQGNAEVAAGTILAQAYRLGKYDVMEVLLDVGSPPNAVLDQEMTVLSHAVKENNIEVCKMLLDHGCDPNQWSGMPTVRSGPCGNSLCYVKSSEICQMLLKSGADVIRHQLQGGFKAIRCVQDVEICRMLLDAGADVNDALWCLNMGINMHNPDRPLQDTVMVMSFEKFKLLVEYGVDLNKY